MQMNLPGSVMGACSRAEAAGTVTHSLIEATASALAAPPSRNSRADGGTSAAAISCARTTPRAARVAATLAELVQEKVEAQRASATAHGLYVAGAVAVNAFLTPGRAIACAAGAAVGAAVLVVTVGSIAAPTAAPAMLVVTLGSGYRA